MSLGPIGAAPRVNLETVRDVTVISCAGPVVEPAAFDAVTDHCTRHGSRNEPILPDQVVPEPRAV